MTAQLGHLQNLPPSAALRVLPYGSTIETDVTLLEIGDRGRMTLAVSQIFGRMVYEENDEQVQRMSELFEALWQQALPPTDSQELIGRIASEVEE